MTISPTLTPVDQNIASLHHEGTWAVIVLNDDHNSFEGVAKALANTLPNTSLDVGLIMAQIIHEEGMATVWTGNKEPAAHYHERLHASGLTMAPLTKLA